ncbi:MAG: DUF2752 domain-containing protein [Lachnospiraceae bacterium]|nr:DUF2752 domain-containing protein [Lachnospiraceae bacterium]
MIRIMNVFHRVKTDIANNYKGIIIVIIYFIVTHILFGYVCPFRLLTGIPCPACGLTRAGISLILLDFDKVFFYNPMIIPIAVFIIYCVICRYIFDVPVRFASAIIVILSILLFILYYYRMVKMFPNHEPMEYVSRNLFSPIYRLIGFNL